jgi:hypothetical protein
VEKRQILLSPPLRLEGGGEPGRSPGNRKLGAGVSATAFTMAKSWQVARTRSAVKRI